MDQNPHSNSSLTIQSAPDHSLSIMHLQDDLLLPQQSAGQHHRPAMTCLPQGTHRLPTWRIQSRQACALAHADCNSMHSSHIGLTPHRQKSCPHTFYNPKYSSCQGACRLSFASMHSYLCSMACCGRSRYQGASLLMSILINLFMLGAASSERPMPPKAPLKRVLQDGGDSQIEACRLE